MPKPDNPDDSLPARLGALARALGVWVVAATKALLVACWFRGWSLVKLLVRRFFEILLAFILLFEEWGWRPLAAWIGRLARFPIVAKIEGVIAGLPPYAALTAFVLPSALLFPLKLLALYLIATGHTVLAALLFVGAKVVGTAVIARLFMLTQPQLMRIGWFALAHDWLMPWKDRMFAAIRASWAWRYGRMVKHKLGTRIEAQWIVLRPRLITLRDRVRARALLAAMRAREWMSG